MIEWVPTASCRAVTVAIPLLFSGAKPIGVLPSESETTPLGVAVPGAFSVTVAVNVPGWPAIDGFARR